MSEADTKGGERHEDQKTHPPTHLHEYTVLHVHTYRHICVHT